MVVKVYISGISGNKEVKKRQQRVSMILDSKCIKYEIIDITEPGRESDKDFMQNNSKSNGGTVSDPNPRSPLPPQLFNDEEYCGDYDGFDLANEVDTLEQFLKVEAPPEVRQPENDKEKTVNGDVQEENKASDENSQESDATDAEKPVANEESAKEGTPVKEGTPIKEGSPVKGGTPLRESSNEPKDKTDESDEQAKGDPPKESTPERQKSVEKEEPVTEKAESPEKEVESKASKENTPEKEKSVNANGTVSSRDRSEEKDAAGDEPTVESKKDPSEALIQSEQTIAAE